MYLDVHRYIHVGGYKLAAAVLFALDSWVHACMHVWTVDVSFGLSVYFPSPATLNRTTVVTAHLAWFVDQREKNTRLGLFLHQVHTCDLSPQISWHCYSPMYTPDILTFNHRHVKTEKKLLPRDRMHSFYLHKINIGLDLPKNLFALARMSLLKNHTHVGYSWLS
jgi:hypothetical protein